MCAAAQTTRDGFAFRFPRAPYPRPGIDATPLCLRVDSTGNRRSRSRSRIVSFWSQAQDSVQPQLQLQQHAQACALFAWLISNRPAVLFSQNKPAPTISHPPNEQADACWITVEPGVIRYPPRFWNSGLSTFALDSVKATDLLQRVQGETEKAHIRSLAPVKIQFSSFLVGIKKSKI
jgi:succinylglutamate desuccinylase